MVVEAPAGTGVYPVLALAEDKAAALVGATGLGGVGGREGAEVSCGEVTAVEGTVFVPVLGGGEGQAGGLVGGRGRVGGGERAGEKVSVVKELAVRGAELELVEVLVPPPTAFLFSFA